MAIHNQPATVATSVKGFSIITMNKSISKTSSFVSSNNDDAEEMIINFADSSAMDAADYTFSVITMDNLLAKIADLVDPTYNFSFKGQTIHSESLRVSDKKRFRILDSPAHPLIFHDGGV